MWSTSRAPPVTSATLGIVQVFWGLDKKLAQRKHFPSVNWNISYTKYMRVLEPFFENMTPEYTDLRMSLKQILAQEDDLTEIVQLVGKDSLSEDQKVVMEVARIIREDFLQQNAFSDYDYTCPLYKGVGMMRVIVNFYRQAQKAIADSPAEAKVTWAAIRTAMAPLLTKITELKFVDPKVPEAQMGAQFQQLYDEIDLAFDNLND